MSHLDEGTLHALLDGELDLHEVKEIQAHIGSCAACGTRLREVKEFHGESDRLVGILEVPAAPSRWTAGRPTSAEPGSGDRSRASEPPPTAAPAELCLAPRGPRPSRPPLLLPENPEYGRGRFMRRMRWAALILVTVGAGYMGNQMRRTGSSRVRRTAAARVHDRLGPGRGAEHGGGGSARAATDTSAPSTRRPRRRPRPRARRRCRSGLPLVRSRRLRRAARAPPGPGSGTSSGRDGKRGTRVVIRVGMHPAKPPTSKTRPRMRRADAASPGSRRRTCEPRRLAHFGSWTGSVRLDRAAAATAALDSARRRDAMAPAGRADRRSRAAHPGAAGADSISGSASTRPPSSSAARCT